MTPARQRTGGICSCFGAASCFELVYFLEGTFEGGVHICSLLCETKGYPSGLLGRLTFRCTVRKFAAKEWGHRAWQSYCNLWLTITGKIFTIFHPKTTTIPLSLAPHLLFRRMSTRLGLRYSSTSYSFRRRYLKRLHSMMQSPPLNGMLLLHTTQASTAFIMLLLRPPNHSGSRGAPLQERNSTKRRLCPTCGLYLVT